MSTREQRGDQMFPVLEGARVEMALRFASGSERHFAPGEMLYDHGQQGAPAWLGLSGSVDITQCDGLDREAPVVTFGSGQFTGKVNQLAGRPAITRARAGEEGATARPFDVAHLRGLMIGSAEIGKTLMRTDPAPCRTDRGGRRAQLSPELGTPPPRPTAELSGAVGLYDPERAQGPMLHCLRERGSFGSVRIPRP